MGRGGEGNEDGIYLERGMVDLVKCKVTEANLVHRGIGRGERKEGEWERR